MVGDGLRCLLGKQADEGHLNSDGVCSLILVAISKLETQRKRSIKNLFFVFAQISATFGCSACFKTQFVLMLLFKLLEYILKKILKQLRRSCLVSPITKNVTAHMCSSVDIGSEPHRFVPGRAPPHFTRYAGWVGGDASLSGVHVAVNLDGIFYTALVWIHPVFPYKRK